MLHLIKLLNRSYLMLKYFVNMLNYNSSSSLFRRTHSTLYVRVQHLPGQSHWVYLPKSVFVTGNFFHHVSQTCSCIVFGHGVVFGHGQINPSSRKTRIKSVFMVDGLYLFSRKIKGDSCYKLCLRVRNRSPASESFLIRCKYLLKTP